MIMNRAEPIKQLVNCLPRRLKFHFSNHSFSNNSGLICNLFPLWPFLNGVIFCWSFVSSYSNSIASLVLLSVQKQSP